MKYTDKPPFHLQPKHFWGSVVAVLIVIYAMWPPSEEELRQREQEARAAVEKAAEERIARETEYLKWKEEFERSTQTTERRLSPAELREKALAEWDSAIRNDIEARRARLREASVEVITDTSGLSRKDAYRLKDGRIVMCRTTVKDSGTVMSCDGDV